MDLKSPVKRLEVAGRMGKERSFIHKKLTSFRSKDTTTESEGMKKAISFKWKQKESWNSNP